MIARRATRENPQDYVIRRLMWEIGMKHGDEAIVTIRGLNVLPVPGSFNEKGEIFFCNTEEIEPHRKLTYGDGKDLPDIVEFPTLVVLDYGIVNLENVLLGSNGRIYVYPTKETKVVVI